MTAIESHTPKTIRVRIGKEVSEVAARAGLAEKSVRNLEAAKNVELETIRRVVRALNEFAAEVGISSITEGDYLVALDVERAHRAAIAKAGAA